MSIAEDINQFRETLKDLKEKMLKMLKMCEGREFKQSEALGILNEGLINLLDIKSLNRQIQGEVENIKDYVNNEKEKVEDKNLRMQNYLYQKENIVSQINSCINFPTNEMNKIQMPNKEEVLDYIKEKDKNKKEEEIKIMDYLECEFEIRKKLNEKVNLMIKEKDENILKLKDFEKYYLDLPNYLSNLENSTLKSQNFLNLNYTERRKNMNLSGKLPSPLFILYNLFECFTNDIADCEVNIRGKEENIEEFNSKYCKFMDHFSESKNFEDENEEIDLKLKEEGEHSEGEIEDEETIDKKNAKKKKKKRRNLINSSINSNYYGLSNTIFNFEDLSFKEMVSSIAHRAQKLSKFPLYIEVKFNRFRIDESDSMLEYNIYPLYFNFYFLPVVNLISVDLVQNLTNQTQIQGNNFGNFTTTQILNNIFSPPSGLFTNIKETLEHILSECCYEFGKTEKIYDYLQILTNNNFCDSKKLREFCKIYLYTKHKFHSLSITNGEIINLNKNYDETIFNNCLLYTNFSENSSNITIDNFMIRLKDRFKYLPKILSQVDYLLKYKSLKSEIIDEFKNEKKFQLVKEKTNISEVFKITKKEFFIKYEEIFNPNNDKFRFLSYFNNENEKIYTKQKNYCTDGEALYLCIIFERKNYRISAYVEIKFDFPSNIPRFFLRMENMKNPSCNIPDNLKEYINKENNMEDFKTENCGYSHILRDIEAEVNEFSHEIFNKNKKYISWIFSYQIRTIKMCLDIFADRENSKFNSFFNSQIIANRRKRPFSLNEINKIFDQN